MSSQETIVTCRESRETKEDEKENDKRVCCTREFSVSSLPPPKFQIERESQEVESIKENDLFHFSCTEAFQTAGHGRPVSNIFFHYSSSFSLSAPSLCCATLLDHLLLLLLRENRSWSTPTSQWALFKPSLR